MSIFSDFEANLTRAGWDLGVPAAGIMWEEIPSRINCCPSCDCNAQGVLKLVAPEDVTGVKIELTLADPYQWTYYLYAGVADANSNLSFLKTSTLKYFCINHGDQSIFFIFNQHFSLHLNIYVMGLRPL